MRALGRLTMRPLQLGLTAFSVVVLAHPCTAYAQETRAPGATVTGRVSEAPQGTPMAGVFVTVEGTILRTLTDSAGRYRLANVPAGPQVLRAQRLGYSPSRSNITVPTSGTLSVDVQLARHALELKGVQVNADPMSRARGELGTASVIEQEAIRNQVAASLAGVLELVPGVPLQAPGLDNVQQISLRSVPISSGAVPSDRSAENLAAFGTLIVLDGVPLSNNANLQTLGPRGSLGFSSSAGGGIDLRRIPAATIERVEVIRGIPSAKYGDLTNGAIIVDTRAGEVEPGIALRADASTTETSLFGGRGFARAHTATLTANMARTRAQGTRNDLSTRLSAQFAHQLTFAGERDVERLGAYPRLVLDTRADYFQLADDRPEVATLPGNESYSRSSGARLLERLRLRLWSDSRLEWTTAYERGVQRSRSRANLLRGATAVTNRTSPGRQEGRFLAGTYNAAVSVDGAPSHLYSRAELAVPADLGGISHEIRVGAEVRREANDGEGIQFDIENPPQASIRGVQGFDRPRSFASVRPLMTSSLYLDDQMSRPVFGGMLLKVQAGGRLDVLHEGGTPFSGLRDAVLQPRLNAELAPAIWLRLRAGAGRLTKTPSLSDLYPGPDWYDVINVNYFANEPSERLAVLTTFMFDPTNPELGYTISDRAELGAELLVRGSAFSVTAFADRIRGGVSRIPEATFILREHFDLTNVNPGSGQPPEIVEPASSVDSVPVLIQRPANNVTQRGGGIEMTADFPEIPRLRTRVALQGAWVTSRLLQEGPEVAVNFGDFQLAENQARTPYYEGMVRKGERLLLNTRLIHQQPEIGLVITGTVQHTLRERRQNVGAVDSLAFAGYITRGGALVPVPLEDRTLPEYASLRLPRTSVLVDPQITPADWLFSLQVSKTLPRDGRLSFYAFNSFDRVGRYATPGRFARPFTPTRFGLEVTMPILARSP